MEAFQVASIIQNGVKQGKKYSDYAVLYRVNMLSRIYEEIFTSLGIPYQVFGGPGFFQRNEIQNILAFLRLRQDRENKKALNRAAAMLAEINPAIESSQVISAIMDSLAQMGNLEEFSRSGKSAENFLAFIDQVHSEKGNNAVNLMTSHAAKGTEFDTVFIVAAEEGMFPHYNAETEAQLEEERRLFYVSVTRAKNHLFIYFNYSNIKNIFRRGSKNDLFFSSHLGPYTLDGYKTARILRPAFNSLTNDNKLK